MNLETLAVHTGRSVESGSGAVTPSITLSTTFERDPDGSFSSSYIYSRIANPNRTALETALAALEGGDQAFAFASGMAAASAILQTLQSGDHVIMPDDQYHGTRYLVIDVLGRWGLQADFVDMRDLAQVKAAIRPNTRMFLLETPSNPRMNVVDIQALAALAHQSNALCVVDNTWATPVLQQPLALGADVVMHSTTKYLGGHSDVIGGALIIRQGLEETTGRIKTIQNIGGAVPSPFDCWLLLRSLPTLPLRVRAQSDSALKIAQFLDRHPQIEQVHYPGLPSHAGHNIVCRQMRAFGGMISFQVRGGQQEAMAIAARLKLITRATSLGGVESLIEHRASIEGRIVVSPLNLLRFSVGLEHPDDLIADLDQALAV